MFQTTDPSLCYLASPKYLQKAVCLQLSFYCKPFLPHNMVLFLGGLWKITLLLILTPQPTALMVLGRLTPFILMYLKPLTVLITLYQSKKLSHCRLAAQLCQWFASYLNNLPGAFTSATLYKHAVCWTVLGLLVLNILVNDLSAHVQYCILYIYSCILQYADDIKLYCCLANTRDHLTLQNDIFHMYLVST